MMGSIWVENAKGWKNVKEKLEPEQVKQLATD